MMKIKFPLTCIVETLEDLRAVSSALGTLASLAAVEAHDDKIGYSTNQAYYRGTIDGLFCATDPNKWCQVITTIYRDQRSVDPTTQAMGIVDAQGVYSFFNHSMGEIQEAWREELEDLRSYTESKIENEEVCTECLDLLREFQEKNPIHPIDRLFVIEK